MSRLKRKSSEEAIVDAAIAVLASNPGASLSEVALAAGVGRSTLHHHFRTRAELVEAISLLSVTETNAATRRAIESEGTAHQRLERMLEAVVPIGDRFHFVVSAPAMAEPMSPDADAWVVHREELAWVEKLVVDLQTERTIDPSIPIGWAVATIDNLIWQAWREMHEGRLAPVDAPRLALRTVLGGLGSAGVVGPETREE